MALLSSFTTDIHIELAPVSEAIAEQKFNTGGATWPLANTGIVEVAAFIESGSSFVPAEGVINAMTPASGVGPLYFDTAGFPDPQLTQTSSATGGGVFINATPGMVEVSFALAGKTCVTSENGWHGSTAQTVAVPAVANALVFNAVLCR